MRSEYEWELYCRAHFALPGSLSGERSDLSYNMIILATEMESWYNTTDLIQTCVKISKEYRLHGKEILRTNKERIFSRQREVSGRELEKSEQDCIVSGRQGLHSV